VKNIILPDQKVKNESSPTNKQVTIEI